jgi:hypothetical protein
MKMTENEMIQKKKDPIYPTINVYSNSRVANQRVNNAKIPLLKYRSTIEIKEGQNQISSEVVDSSYLRKF